MDIDKKEMDELVLKTVKEWLKKAREGDVEMRCSFNRKEDFFNCEMKQLPIIESSELVLSIKNIL